MTHNARLDTLPKLNKPFTPDIFTGKNQPKARAHIYKIIQNNNGISEAKLKLSFPNGDYGAFETLQDEGSVVLKEGKYFVSRQWADEIKELRSKKETTQDVTKPNERERNNTIPKAQLCTSASNSNESLNKSEVFQNLVVEQILPRLFMGFNKNRIDIEMSNVWSIKPEIKKLYEQIDTIQLFDNIYKAIINEFGFLQFEIPSLNQNIQKGIIDYMRNNLENNPNFLQ
jgi:hypothetical protein